MDRDWLEFRQEHRLEISITRRSNCHGNAVAESFLSNLKLERVEKSIYSTRDEARRDLMQNVEGYYNL